MMEYTKNGQGDLGGVACETTGRIYPVTPDGSQWEVKIYTVAHFPHGKEIIGETTFRSMNGGVAPLASMAVEAATLAQQLVKKLTDNQNPRIVAAREIPKLKGN